MSMAPRCTCSLLSGPAEDCPAHGNPNYGPEPGAEEKYEVPVPQAGLYVVATSHIQRLITNALDHAKIADGQKASMRVEDMLEKAAADLRHAAEELTAERLACKGYPRT